MKSKIIFSLKYPISNTSPTYLTWYQLHIPMLSDFFYQDLKFYLLWKYLGRTCWPVEYRPPTPPPNNIRLDFFIQKIAWYRPARIISPRMQPYIWVGPNALRIVSSDFVSKYFMEIKFNKTSWIFVEPAHSIIIKWWKYFDWKIISKFIFLRNLPKSVITVSILAWPCLPVY